MHTTNQEHIIENADATPPHLDVFARLGSSGDMLGFCSFDIDSAVCYVWRWAREAVLV